MVEEESGIEKYVDLIIFSTIYGLLAVFIIFHVIGRWHFRRRSLKFWKARTPGDDSFRNKHVKQRINEDFQAIIRLTSDPRLVDDSLPQNVFGGGYGRDDTPVHWYRMKAFDIAAEFVTSHSGVLCSEKPLPSATTLALPKFLGILQRKEILPGEAADDISAAIKSYKDARYSAGEFGAEDLERFSGNLARLENLVSKGQPLTPPTSGPTTSVPPQIHHAAHLDKDRNRYSQEPLLEDDLQQPNNGWDKEGPGVDHLLPRDSSRDHSRLSHKGARGGGGEMRSTRPISLELSPLIDSQPSTPGVLSNVSQPSFSPKTVHLT